MLLLHFFTPLIFGNKKDAAVMPRLWTICAVALLSYSLSKSEPAPCPTVAAWLVRKKIVAKVDGRC
jgi:hypothetical protein